MKTRTYRIFVIVLFGGMILLVLVFFIFSLLQETASLTEDVQQSAPGNFVQLENGKVHYQLLGPDTAHLIIFIHGGGITGLEVWQHTTPYFHDKGYRVLSYDLYDRGYSDRVRAENSPELFLSQLTQLTEALHIDKPAHIVCMSMGAIIALDYFAAYPEKVDKMVMLDPAASGDFKMNTMLKVPVVSDFLMTVYWYPRAKENQRKEFVDMALFDAYSKRVDYFMNFKGYKRTNYSTWMYMLNQNKLSKLKNLPPDKLLLIYGSADPYFPEHNTSLYRSDYPTLRIEKINDAGHMPHFEKPQEVNPLIHSFFGE